MKHSLDKSAATSRRRRTRIDSRIDTPAQLLGIRDVAAMVGLGTRTIERYLDDGRDFPAPVLVAPRLRKWRRRDVQAWIDRLSGEAP